MKLLRTIALDPSDTFIFDPPAEPGDWAVSGAFRFWGGDPNELEGKSRLAFRGGFLGLQSWGWSTLVQIVEVRADERVAVVDLLAQQLMNRLGAPDLATARRAAEEEVAFSESLCSHPPDTLVAVHRSAEGGEVREVFRTLHPRSGPKPLRAFAFLDVDDGGQPVDEVDLLGMAVTDTERGPK
jgi:hypothetical protein